MVFPEMDCQITRGTIVPLLEMVSGVPQPISVLVCLIPPVCDIYLIDETGTLKGRPILTLGNDAMYNACKRRLFSLE